jgi:hypothetical protein
MYLPLVASIREMELPAGDRGLDGLRWCVVTGGRGFMARHLVAALLRSGDWRVRITDLAPVATLEPDEEGLLGAALRVGLAEYVSADVCDLAQLTKGNLWEIQCFFLFLPKRTPSFSHTHPRFCPRNSFRIFRSYIELN